MANNIAADNITFAKTLDGAQAVTINTAGDTIFTGKVGFVDALTSLTTDDSGAGKTYVNGGLVKTVGAQTFNDPVVVGSTAAEFTSTGDMANNIAAGDITFAKTLDGAQAVTINTAGDTIFTGKVGFADALTSLTTDFAGAGKTLVNGGLVKTVGAQTFNDPVVVGTKAAQFTSTGDMANNIAAGNITFAKTLDGAQAVTINTAGDTVFNGKVGFADALTSLTTDFAGTGKTYVNGGLVKTVGAQTFNDPVVVGTKAAQFTSTGDMANNIAAGNITFAKTLDGAQAVTINTAGDTVFNGKVGFAAVWEQIARKSQVLSVRS
jgi:uncharacterized membrane protein